MDRLPWKHIMEEQPDHGESIIQIDFPYMGHYCMGMRDYYQVCTFQELLDFCKESEIPNPNFWWISAKDFPFPDKKEASDG